MVEKRRRIVKAPRFSARASVEDTFKVKQQIRVLNSIYRYVIIIIIIPLHCLQYIIIFCLNSLSLFLSLSLTLSCKMY
jgi:hypothetical protein